MCIRDRIMTILIRYQNLSIHLLDVGDENIVVHTKSQKNRKKVLLDVWAYQQNVIERKAIGSFGRAVKNDAKLCGRTTMFKNCMVRQIISI